MRTKLHVTPEQLRDPQLRRARFAALLKDGTVIQGRIGFSTTVWFGYSVDGTDEVLRVALTDIDSAEIG